MVIHLSKESLELKMLPVREWYRFKSFANIVEGPYEKSEVKKTQN